MAHNLLPGRILQRADASFADDGDDADGVLLGRGLASDAANPERAGDAGEAATHGTRGGKHGTRPRDVAEGRLEDTNGGGSGGWESGRHGRAWTKRLHVEPRLLEPSRTFSAFPGDWAGRLARSP